MNHELLEILAFAGPIIFGLIGVLIAAPLGRSKLFGFFLGVIGGPHAVSRFAAAERPSEELLRPKKPYHKGIEELFIAKQMLERGEISREQYEDARAELMAKLD